MKKVLIFVFALTIFSLAQEGIKVSIKTERYSNPTIRTEEISKKLLKVTVKDRKGEPIPNLTTNDFEVVEDGFKGRVVKVVPLSESQESSLKVVLCLDNSSSMSPHLEEVLQILDKLVSLFPKKTSVEVILFDEGGKKKVKQKGDLANIYTTSIKGSTQNVKAYYRLEYKSLTNKTYLYDQLYYAFELLKKDESKYDEIFTIVLSDGVDVGSEKRSGDVYTNFIKKGKLFLVDFSIQGNRFLKEFSEDKEAKYFQASNVEQLSNYFREIGDKIVFSGYEVTYESKVPPQIFLDNFSSLMNNQKIPVKKLQIEEVKSREIFPLLNYVFFEKNSSELSKKYLKYTKENRNSFSILQVLPTQMDVYYNILNILGERLQKYPDAKITLTGCNDDTEEEKGNKVLSTSRAAIVSEYLVNVWDIAPERIKIQSRNLPQIPSNKKDSLGMEENRRVEIVSSDPAILEVVEVFSISKVSNPEFIYVNNKYSAKSDIKSWELKITQDSQILFSQNGTGNLPATIPVNINSFLAGKSLTKSDFNVSISAVDANGNNSIPNEFKLPISLLTQETKKLEAKSDRFIEKVSLVLFEFNSSNIDTRNKSAIMKLDNSIKDNSTLIVKGYTDAIGSEEVNLRLSQNRAKNVLESLKKLLKPATKLLSSEGLGKIVPLYDNMLPEGRFYNRTCQIVIETPIVIETLETGNNE